ncbi:MAG TPA: Hsp20/alpha crystallin family protein [Candidatus Acidoferrales bacterium]|nr:Hsp20/alpha crystallin family protein [Candidatus Acidoferrales bacterium]
MSPNVVEAHVKIVPNSDPSTVDQRMREAVARRAFQIFESRGGGAGHEQQDWSLAESEIVRPLSCGVLETQHGVEVAMDLAGFEVRRGIEIVAEPHRLVLCGFGSTQDEYGKARPKKGPFPEIFRTVNLPAAVDATKIESVLRGHVLQIRVPKATRLAPAYGGQVESGPA